MHRVKERCRPRERLTLFTSPPVALILFGVVATGRGAVFWIPNREFENYIA